MKTPTDELADKLYEASDALLADGPSVRIDDVARLLDVPRATLYYYFSGKDDLIGFLMQEKLRRAGEAMSEAVRGDGGVDARLEQALRAMLAVMEDQPGLCVNVVAAFGQAGNLASVLSDADRALSTPLRELLIEGRATGRFDVADVDATVSMLLGALLIPALMAIAREGGLDAAAVGDAVVPPLVRGLTA